MKKYLDLDELTPAVLNDMVKAVYVHEPDNSSGHREQQIDITMTRGNTPRRLALQPVKRRNGIAEATPFPKTTLCCFIEPRHAFKMEGQMLPPWVWAGAGHPILGNHPLDWEYPE